MQINKFLKIIKKRLDNYKNSNGNCLKLNEVIFELDELVNIAEIQISQSNNSWITVDDELPVTQGFYLVHCPSRLGKETTQMSYFCPNMGWDASIEITHWQYLPQPPKE